MAAKESHWDICPCRTYAVAGAKGSSQQEGRDYGAVHSCSADGTGCQNEYRGMQQRRCQDDCRVLPPECGALFSARARKVARGSHHRWQFCEGGPRTWLSLVRGPTAE